MSQKEWHTWDGHPVSRRPPHGAMIVVYRCAPPEKEFLLLHRSHRGWRYEGEWAWGPPSGARYPGEAVDACAERELREETGLRLSLQSTEIGSPQWPVYLAQAPLGTSIILSAEHDRHIWLPEAEAVQLIKPQIVRASFRKAAKRSPPCT